MPARCLSSDPLSDTTACSGDTQAIPPRRELNCVSEGTLSTLLLPIETEAKCYCTSQGNRRVCSAYLGDNILSTCQELQLMRHRTEEAKCSNWYVPSFQTLIAEPYRKERTKN